MREAQQTLVSEYVPQPKQRLLHLCAANEILYGGAAGPGKSYALRHEGAVWAQRIPGLQVYIFRRTLEELEKSHILESLQEFDRRFGKYKEKKRRWELNNGSMIHFANVQYERDVFNYRSTEFNLLIPDELTTFTEFMYDFMRSRVRCSLNIPEQYRHKIPGVIAASNPGGIGHTFCKRRWVDFARPYEMKRAPKDEGGMLRCYIPGLLQDNAILMERDPTYIDRLNGLPEPYRTAYMTGDWNIFAGQAFNFRIDRHVCKPIPIPEGAPIYMTYDWGFAKPFSIGWWWIDSEGRAYRFMEWYGWDGVEDTGLRMSDPQVAEGIKEREKGVDELRGRTILRYCDKTLFSKRPDTYGGGQGPSTAEVFAQHGLYMIPGDPNRKLKIRQFHSRLHVPRIKVGKGEEEHFEAGLPMIQIYETCEQFIRTIPMLQGDPHNAEDIDTRLEDHVYDEAALLFMARPISMPGVKEGPQESFEDRRIDALIKGTPGPERMVPTADPREILENDASWWENEFEGREGYEEEGYGNLISTV